MVALCRAALGNTQLPFRDRVLSDCFPVSSDPFCLCPCLPKRSFILNLLDQKGNKSPDGFHTCFHPGSRAKLLPCLPERRLRDSGSCLMLPGRLFGLSPSTQVHRGRPRRTQGSPSPPRQAETQTAAVDLRVRSAVLLYCKPHLLIHCLVSSFPPEDRCGGRSSSPSMYIRESTMYQYDVTRLQI